MLLREFRIEEVLALFTETFEPFSFPPQIFVLYYHIMVDVSLAQLVSALIS
jgi:hypothetical protein